MVAGRNYIFETRWADGDPDRFPVLAAELLAQQPAVVVVATILAARAVQQISPKTPIVMSSMNMPVQVGLVASLARPGGSITGVDNMSDEILAKTIEILHEAFPSLRRLTLFANATNPSHPSLIAMATREATTAGLTVDSVAIATPAGLDDAFSAIARQRPEMLLVLTDNSLRAIADVIIHRALSLRIPTSCPGLGLLVARAGALICYATDAGENSRTVARLIRKVLDGISPADLPVERPTKFQLLINLKTAKTLGIVIPPTLLARADEVIE
jgi:putative ABC transport system substrate-binding protein